VIKKIEKMTKIHQGMAEILAKMCGFPFPREYTAQNMQMTTFTSGKRQPHVFGCISAISGWILVIFSILSSHI
jgi:hypothetical protein